MREFVIACDQLNKLIIFPIVSNICEIVDRFLTSFSHHRSFTWWNLLFEKEIFNLLLRFVAAAAAAAVIDVYVDVAMFVWFCETIRDQDFSR